ncbi:hypothetical protein MLD38_032088 [Melastoma candidum]|uniref:Uncharacterized protein n=1 Tax=Melastoma candidum TaxID=119954 RepID=A0ACB9M2I5_9MYRT|nr:hypothetical protein MLD38_032088 [Melastoma candidum]
MEEQGIELVLSRATELRSKISNCVHKANPSLASREVESVVGGGNDDDDDDDGEETVTGTAEAEAEERLLSICDAFEVLESQLSSLQIMQQNHRYEREVALSEIDFSRKMLLDKLKDYKGRDLEVIQEASAFAGDDAEHDTSLLLPPYPTRPPLHLSSFSSPGKSIRNGVSSSEVVGNLKSLANDAEESPPRDPSSSRESGFGHVVGAVTKTVITVVGIISLLRLYGLRPNRRRSGNGPLNDLGMLLGSIVGKGRERSLRCPPGRVLVMEDGEARCMVKERVEVPFESVVTTPDVNYGCG